MAPDEVVGLALLPSLGRIDCPTQRSWKVADRELAGPLGGPPYSLDAPNEAHALREREQVDAESESP